MSASQKLPQLESNKGSFYNQTNWIEADITTTMDITLIRGATKVTVTLIPKLRRKTKKI